MAFFGNGKRIEAQPDFPKTSSGDFPKPEPQPLGVSHSGAEELCAQWMRYLGAVDARKTRDRADGGIDVVSEKYVAQVKNFSGAVPAESVSDLVGAGIVHDRIPLFITSGSYPTGSIEFANQDFL